LGSGVQPEAAAHNPVLVLFDAFLDVGPLDEEFGVVVLKLLLALGIRFEL
jgi:hypothetical protein